MKIGQLSFRRNGMKAICKLLLVVCLCGGFVLPMYAQMSDEQVVNYVKESKAAGKGEQEIGRETAINRIAHRINTLKDANRSEKQPVMNPQLAGIGGIPNRKRGITRTRHKQSPFEIQFILNPFARLNALPHRNRLRSERPTAQQ